MGTRVDSSEGQPRSLPRRRGAGVVNSYAPRRRRRQGRGSASDSPWLAITREYQRALSFGVRCWVA